MDNWFEVFRTGTHTDSAGNTSQWTKDDLDRIAQQYDPTHHEAPIVIGHPETDSPAYGWIQALKVEGEKLLRCRGSSLMSSKAGLSAAFIKR